MSRSFALVCALTAAASLFPAPARAQQASPLAGVWTLNRSLSELPREFGFNIDTLTTAGGRRDSSQDAQRVQLLTGEVRNPPGRLMIVDSPAAVTITNELGQSRTLHPTGREETIDIQGVLFQVTSRHDGDRLVAVYHVAQDRDVRYTYSTSAVPARLSVEVQFLERGAGDKATRMYEAGVGAAPITTTKAADAPSGTSQQPRETFDQRPGAEFKGLKSLGILVEELGATAAACGLSHDAIESALSKRLSDGGVTVRKNSDDDTYVYVNVITTSVANGICVSRYDAFLYTYATAKLSHRDQPVLVQVSLMHRGSIDSSGVSGHAAAVTRGLASYIDAFVTQIQSANK